MESRSLSFTYTITGEMINLYKVSRLLMGPCTEQLRDLLMSYIPPAKFPAVMQRKISRLPRLTETQRELILPNSGVYSGNYDDMDISLLYILLRNVCGIQSHNNSWGKTPDFTDRSVSANIERLRLAWNRFVHTTPGGISKFDLKEIAWEIRAAVEDLDKTFGKKYSVYQEEVEFIRERFLF